MRAQLIELTPARPTSSRNAMIVEQRLHDGLAVVEVAFERNVVDRWAN